MTGLNSSEPRKITVLGPYTFNIGDISSFAPYQRGGIATQVKMPQIVESVSIKNINLIHFKHIHLN